jgi:hypothetical protein
MTACDRRLYSAASRSGPRVQRTTGQLALALPRQGSSAGLSTGLTGVHTQSRIVTRPDSTQSLADTRMRATYPPSHGRLERTKVKPFGGVCKPRKAERLPRDIVPLVEFAQSLLVLHRTQRQAMVHLGNGFAPLIFQGSRDMRSFDPLCASLVLLIATGCGNSSSSPAADPGDAGHSNQGGTTSISTCGSGCDNVCDITNGCSCVCASGTGGGFG